MDRRSSTNEAYWRDYDGLQAVKHGILATYMDAWFPILSSYRGLLLYLDCHAGRGRHKTGDPGSPLLVLERLLNHQRRRNILERVAVSCHFFEENESNAMRLGQEITKLGPLPPRISIGIHPTDYEAELSRFLDKLDSIGTGLPPSFAFIDPYGFKLSMRFMNRLLAAGRTETLINFMYRYVDMAFQVEDKANILDRLFGTRKWRDVASIGDYQRRFEGTVKLFSDQLEAKYVSWVVMRGDTDAIKYVLFHATNDVRGRQEMKRAMWRVLPDGSFTAYERDRPEQGVLISATQSPDREVIALVASCFGGKTVRLQDEVYPVIDASPCRRVHVHKILKRAVARGIMENLTEPGKFTINRNPQLVIPRELPDSLADSLDKATKSEQTELFK